MFKDNLVSVRKMHGFSQDELAEKIGGDIKRKGIRALYFT